MKTKFSDLIMPSRILSYAKMLKGERRSKWFILFCNMPEHAGCAKIIMSCQTIFKSLKLIKPCSVLLLHCSPSYITVEWAILSPNNFFI